MLLCCDDDLVDFGSSIKRGDASSQLYNGRVCSITIACPPFDIIEMKEHRRVSGPWEDWGVGLMHNADVMWFCGAFFYIGSSMHCWHATSPPKPRRVCSVIVGPPIDTEIMDTDHPNGDEWEDQGVMWMHNAVVMFCRTNKSSFPCILEDMPYHHLNMAEFVQSTSGKPFTQSRWTKSIPTEAKVWIKVLVQRTMLLCFHASLLLDWHFNHRWHATSPPQYG